MWRCPSELKVADQFWRPTRHCRAFGDKPSTKCTVGEDLVYIARWGIVPSTKRLLIFSWNVEAL